MRWLLVTLILFEPLIAAPRTEQQQARIKRQTQAAGKCLNYEYAGFFCVPIYQCSNDGVIRTAAQGLFDPRSTSEDEVCGEFYDEFPEDCCPPDRAKASAGRCSASLDVCCLHPNSTAQYEEEYLDKFGCEPNGGFIKGGEDEECSQRPDCELFGNKCCEDIPAPVTTAPPCVEDSDCAIFGTGCCETNILPTEPSCEPNESDCEIFGTGCCIGEPAACTEDEQIFGDCDAAPDSPVTTTPKGTTFSPAETTSPNPPPRPKRTNNPKVTGEPACGKRNPRGVDAVPVTPKAGDAKFGEWPHVCAILKREKLGEDTAPLKIYQCGASLIDYGIILTAAHCVANIEAADLIVRCGEWNTQNEKEKLPYQELQVVVIKSHPDFEMSTHKNNFAILFLEGTGFEAMSHIAPVCLPQPCSTYNEENCVANGWGKDKFGSDGRYASILKEVVYPVVSRNQCQKQLRTTRLGRFFELDKSFICAGGVKGVDTCKGDGGSPLTCKIQGSTNSWVQAGIVSWGIGCGEEGVPAVYANVAHVVCWIDNEVKLYYDGEESSRFGFLPTVDCNGAEPTQDCRIEELQLGENTKRTAILNEIFS